MKFLVPAQLETDRLILRQFKDDDWQGLHKYYSNADATAYTVGRAFSEGESWRAMASMVGHWQLRGYGSYALELKSSGETLGTVGFWAPNDWPEPEIKWALAPEFWGKGYASEAARIVQQAGLEFLPDLPLISLIHPDNHPSIALAEAISATLETTIAFRGADWCLYRHPLRD